MEFKKPSKKVHAALNIGCKTCHMTVEAKAHPRQKDSMKLIQDIPGLCYKCHDESKYKGKFVHSPIAEGKCTSCHKPHYSNFSKLLISNPPELCYTCHEKTNFTKKYVHMVIIGRRCNCHNPHASDSSKLLSTTTNEVCLGCHRAKGTGMHIVSLPGRKIHPIEGVPEPGNPKRKMTCTTCHNPHSSDFPKLFPSSMICKWCHKNY